MQFSVNIVTTHSRIACNKWTITVEHVFIDEQRGACRFMFPWSKLKPFSVFEYDKQHMSQICSINEEPLLPCVKTSPITTLKHLLKNVDIHPSELLRLKHYQPKSYYLQTVLLKVNIRSSLSTLLYTWNHYMACFNKWSKRATFEVALRASSRFARPSNTAFTNSCSIVIPLDI